MSSKRYRRFALKVYRNLVICIVSGFSGHRAVGFRSFGLSLARIVHGRRRIWAIGLACLLGLTAWAQVPGERSWSVRMAESVMQQQSMRSERWHYEVGVLLRAFEELWKRTGNPQYFAYIRVHIDPLITPEGAIRT